MSINLMAVKVFNLCVRALAATAVVGALSLPMPAQTPGSGTGPIPPPFPDPSTCPIQGGIKSFVLEVPITGASFATQFIPTLSPALLAALQDTTKDVHTHFTFNTSDMVLRGWSFPIAKGAPAITPASTNFDAIAAATIQAPVDKMVVLCSPRPTIALYGPILTASPVVGSLNGLPHALTFSYDATSTTYTNNAYNIVSTDGGANVVIGLLGSVNVTPASTTAVVNGGNMIQTLYRQLTLDGTPSMTDNGPLTYQWSSPGSPVAILDPTMPQTRIQINGLQGTYPVTLKVTSATGQSASTTVNVSFVGR